MRPFPPTSLLFHWLLVLGVAASPICSPSPVAAQDAHTSDVQAWAEYEFRSRINPRLRISWDLGYRDLISTEDLLGDWSRLQTRADLVYSRWRRIDLDAGAGAYYTLQDGDQVEIRAWQGATFRWPERRFARRQWGLRHRLRLEQRYIRYRKLGESDFGMRFRYRLATFVPLNRPSIEDGAFYVPLMGEYFFDLGDDVSEFFAARARLSAGLGRVLSPNWTLEFRYTAQSSRDTATDLLSTTDHIFDLRIRTAIRLRDLVTGW